ncbi:unnamed protein product [Allacma fusca]|uniref:Uncharacterized protein n=1 Tax=Allacma fusca TaxID=39272 RepID=A0A8J2KQX1_9HEXA|nr:unnamed protein product [Allacma fusca]
MLEMKKINRSPGSHFIFPTLVLKNYLNFAHLVFLNPYSIDYCDDRREFIIPRSSIPRKVLVALIHISVFALYIGQSQRLVNTSSSNEYNELSQTLIFMSWGMSVTLSMHLFWFRTAAIVPVINNLQLICLKMGEQGIAFKSGMMRFLAVLLPLYSVLYTLFTLLGRYFLEYVTGFHISVTTFFGNVKMLSVMEKEDRSLMENILVTGIYAAASAAVCITITGYCLTAAIAIAYWLILRKFVNHVMESPPTSDKIGYVLDTIEAIGTTFSDCERAVGIMFRHIGLILIPMYAFQLPNVVAENYLLRIQSVLNLSCLVAVLFPSAVCHSLIKSLLPWIQQSVSVVHIRRSLPLEEQFRINVLMQQINANYFGFSGKLFTVTFEFIGGVLSIILTYAIISKGCNCDTACTGDQHFLHPMEVHLGFIWN